MDLISPKVDVSINEAYGSHLKHNEDLQMEAFLANWQMEEDVADEHLLEGVSNHFSLTSSSQMMVLTRRTLKSVKWCVTVLIKALFE